MHRSQARRARARQRAAHSELRAMPTRARQCRRPLRLRQRCGPSVSPFAGITRIRFWRSAAR